jgi:hypothetical protein
LPHRASTAAAIAVAALAACAQKPADAAALTKLIASVATEQASIESHNRTVVLNDACLPASLPGLRKAIEDNLAAHQLPFTAMAESCDPARLAGPWRASDLDAKAENLGHILLFVELSGEGNRRGIRVGCLCGRLCGSGATIDALWDGESWLQKSKYPVLY